MLSLQTVPPFTRESLEILFERSNFKAFQKSGHLSHYWAPLISACSGTRRNEIFFLTPDDILQKHGIWIIRINGRDSTGESAASLTREIPIHPLLKRLGFLEFVQARKQTHPNERLFSEYKALGEQAGVLFSRAFANWIKTTVARLPDEKKGLFADDFHFPSLRALFTEESIRSDMSEQTCRWLHGGNGDSQTARDEDQEQRNLERADIEMQRVDIGSCFPALYSYQELMA